MRRTVMFLLLLLLRSPSNSAKRVRSCDQFTDTFQISKIPIRQVLLNIIFLMKKGKKLNELFIIITNRIDWNLDRLPGTQNRSSVLYEQSEFGGTLRLFQRRRWTNDSVEQNSTGRIDAGYTKHQVLNFGEGSCLGFKF